MHFSRSTGGALFLLALSVFSPLVASAPAADAAAAAAAASIKVRNADITPNNAGIADAILSKRDIPVENTEFSSTLTKRTGDSAGLLWGPVFVGNLKLSLTNVHSGPVGPRFPGSVPHVNFHVDKQKTGPRGGYSRVVNMHMVVYESAGRQCLYAWDSVRDATVFDNCFDNLSDALSAGVNAIKAFVDTLLRNADAIASVAIIAALGVALLAALAALPVVLV